MTSRRVHTMERRRHIIAFAAVLGIAGCDAHDLLQPAGSDAAQVVLSASTAAPLASLGDTAAVTLQVLDRTGKPVQGVRLRWSVSPAGVLVAEGDGLYRAVANGRATITAAIDAAETGVRPSGYWAAPIADSIVVEVRQQPARLAFAPADTAFTSLGALRQLHVFVTDARGNPLQDGPPPLSWHSADEHVAKVDGDGIVRSIGEGVTRISVHAGQLSGSAVFTVNPRLPHTSCMVYAQRRQTRQSCVTLDFTMREKETAR